MENDVLRGHVWRKGYLQHHNYKQICMCVVVQNPRFVSKIEVIFSKLPHWEYSMLLYEQQVKISVELFNCNRSKMDFTLDRKHANSHSLAPPSTSRNSQKFFRELVVPTRCHRQRSLIYCIVLMPCHDATRVHKN